MPLQSSHSILVITNCGCKFNLLVFGIEEYPKGTQDNRTTKIWKQLHLSYHQLIIRYIQI